MCREGLGHRGCGEKVWGTGGVEGRFRVLGVQGEGLGCSWVLGVWSLGYRRVLGL